MMRYHFPSCFVQTLALTNQVAGFILPPATLKGVLGFQFSERNSAMVSPGFILVSDGDKN